MTSPNRNQHTFAAGSEGAKRAAEKSAEVRRKKREEREASAAAVAAAGRELGKARAEEGGMATSLDPSSVALRPGEVGVVVAVPYVEVMRNLARQAIGGDVNAARVLLAWKASHPEVSEHQDVELLPAHVRDRMVKRLLAEIAQEDGDQSVDPDPGQESISPLAASHTEAVPPPQQEGGRGLDSGRLLKDTHTQD